MSELDEIMKGKHEIKHLHIEGDTIAFETELNNYTWNLTPRDIGIIIYYLQNQLQQKENIMKEVREYIEHENFKRTILVGVSTKKYTRDILNNILEILDRK